MGRKNKHNKRENKHNKREKTPLNTNIKSPYIVKIEQEIVQLKKENANLIKSHSKEIEKQKITLSAYKGLLMESIKGSPSERAGGTIVSLLKSTFE